jgi:hypothetical protein
MRVVWRWGAVGGGVWRRETARWRRRGLVTLLVRRLLARASDLHRSVVDRTVQMHGKCCVCSVSGSCVT